MPSLSCGPSGSRTCGSASRLRAGCRAAARLEQRLAQALELRVLGMQAAQIVAGRLGRGHGLQHDLGVAQGRLLVEVAAELRRIEAAAAGMARILQDGQAELDLGVGKRRRRRLAGPAAAGRRRAAARPQSSALAISAMAWRARALRPPLSPTPARPCARHRRPRPPPGRRDHVAAGDAAALDAPGPPADRPPRWAAGGAAAARRRGRISGREWIRRRLGAARTGRQQGSAQLQG